MSDKDEEVFTEIIADGRKNEFGFVQLHETVIMWITYRQQFSYNEYRETYL